MSRQHSGTLAGQLRSGLLTPDVQPFRLRRGIGETSVIPVGNQSIQFAHVFIRRLESSRILRAVGHRLEYLSDKSLFHFIRGLRDTLLWPSNDQWDSDNLDEDGLDDSDPIPPPLCIAGLDLVKYRSYCMVDRTKEEALRVQHIGEKLRLLRMASEITREELAYLLNSDIELVAAIENGFGDLKHALLLIYRLDQLAE